MKNPFVSVIIPVWNRPGFVAECIESVLNQTYENFEVVVIDDGSTDCTCDVVTYMTRSDSRIRLVRKEHSGTSATFNRGIDEVRGDVFCLLGSDDLWMPTKLERQVWCAEVNPGHVIHTESMRIDVHGQPQKDVYKSNLRHDNGGSGPKEFKARCLKPWAGFYGSSLYVPVDALEKAGQFPESVCQDYHWVIRAALLFDIPFTLVCDHLIKNRTNPNGTTCLQAQFIRMEAEDVRRATIAEMEGREYDT